MTLPDANHDADLFVLTQEELHLLRFTCDLYAEEESPLGPLLPMAESAALERAAQSLVSRKLADTGTFRPHRELLRRLLIVSQPDARVVLVEATPGGNERMVDFYQRAGAYLPYRRIDDGHELGSTREQEDVEETLERQFSPRRSTGDFVDVTLGTTEYFAFSLLAGDLLDRLRRTGRAPESDEPPTERVHSVPGPPTKRQVSYIAKEGPSVLMSGGFQDDGTPLQGLLRRLPPELAGGPQVPGEDEWKAAMQDLLDKDIVALTQGRYTLRPYFHDLAMGLADQRRLVLTRFDFGGDDWIVRDATFIVVPGSLFLVRAHPDRTIRVMELDEPTLQSTLQFITEPIHDPDAYEVS